jgi:hypothetical protein
MSDEDDHRDFLLAALRAATLRCRLMEADVNTIGVALKANLIGCDTAVQWIKDGGLFWIVGSIPEEVGRVAKSNTEADTNVDANIESRPDSGFGGT